MALSHFLALLALILAVGGIACLVPAIVMRRRDSQLRVRCTQKAQGRVSGYSTSKQVTGSTFLPTVEYTVNGTKHTVTGPTFAAYTARGVRGDVAGPHTNIRDIADLPEELRVYSYDDAPLERNGNALAEPFPVGRHVTVWYDPDDPGRAYVIRVPATSSMAKTFTLLGVMEIVSAVAFAFFAYLW